MFRIKFSREFVLKILYQADVLLMSIEDTEQLLEQELTKALGLSDVEREFISKLVREVYRDRDSMDARIQEHLIGWTLNRLTPIDRNLMRLALAEAQTNDQKGIIIDDVIRIAKKYSEEESFKIINAVLDKIIP
jgi:N utilization substance protein B